MNDDLASFLAGRQWSAEDHTIWGQYSLRERGYLCQKLPPLPYITSVRTILLHGNDVLVVRDPGSVHILPGGRREPGETLEQTLHREVLEETGWTIAQTWLLGFKHFHHLSSVPPDHPYPHPDFLQVVFAAHAGEYRPEAKEVDGHELEAIFRPVADVKTLNLPSGEFVFLQAAINIRHGVST
jgi:ADP-ribose pyrophosphatase YjhB (NUDIX family)